MDADNLYKDWKDVPTRIIYYSNKEKKLCIRASESSKEKWSIIAPGTYKCQIDNCTNPAYNRCDKILYGHNPCNKFICYVHGEVIYRKHKDGYKKVTRHCVSKNGESECMKSFEKVILEQESAEKEDNICCCIGILIFLIYLYLALFTNVFDFLKKKHDN